MAVTLECRVARSMARYFAIQLFTSVLTTEALAQIPAPMMDQPTKGAGGDIATVVAVTTEPDPQPPARFAFSIRTVTPGKPFDIRVAEQDQVVGRCMGQCTLALPPGSYNVHLYGANGQPDGDTDFSVSGPGSLQVQDANRSVATIGAVMGAVGPVLIVTGLLLIVTSVCIDESIHTDDCPNGNNSRANLGLSSMVAGTIMTPIGWVLFARNRSPRAREKPFLLPYATSTSDYRGGVLGIQGSF